MRQEEIDQNVAAWAFCATEHYPLHAHPQHHYFQYCSVSPPLSVWAACLSSLGRRIQLLRGDFFYSSLKSGLITSTDVTDREENKRETSKDKRSAHRREVHVVILKFRKTQTLRSASMYSQRTTDGNVKKKKGSQGAKSEVSLLRTCRTKEQTFSLGVSLGKK